MVISVSVTIWPAIVADKKGYFKDEGLDFDFINSGSSTRSAQQVAAGSAPIGSSSMVDTMRAIDKGAQIKVFLNSLAVGTHSLIGQKAIHSVKELKGKRVMTGGTGDITNLWWIAMAKANGLDPEKDVELLFSGATTARLAALVAGAVDATMLSTPQSFQAIQDGYSDLGPVAPFLGEFPMMIWHVNEAWAATPREGDAGLHPRPQQGGALHVRSRAQAGGVADAGRRLPLQARRRAEDLGPLHEDQGLRAGRGMSDSATERVRDTLLASGDIKKSGAAVHLCRSPLRRQGEE